MTKVANNINGDNMIQKRKFLFYIFLLIMGLSITIIFYNLTSYFYNSKKQIEFNENLKEMVISNKNKEFFDVNFKELLNINSDTVGFIIVNGTNVNYPVVKGSDNNYYLTHSFIKEENEIGAIYLDYRNDLDELSRNNIIYGHGRLDKTMFGSLSNLLTKEWFDDEDNHYIKLITPKRKMLFEIISVYTIPKESYYLKTYFSSKKYFKKFLEVIMKRSVFNFRTNVSTEDKLLTLSTCQNNYGKRIVVHAKLLMETK